LTVYRRRQVNDAKDVERLFYVMYTYWPIWAIWVTWSIWSKLPDICVAYIRVLR
jgi:hypothetical protein